MKDPVRITRPKLHRWQSPDSLRWINVYHWTTHKRSFSWRTEAERIEAEAAAQEFAAELRRRIDRARFERAEKRREAESRDAWLRRHVEEDRQRREEAARQLANPEPEFKGELVETETYAAEREANNARYEVCPNCRRLIPRGQVCQWGGCYR